MKWFYKVLVSTTFYLSSVVLTHADELRDFLLKQLNATDLFKAQDSRFSSH